MDGAVLSHGHWVAAGSDDIHIRGDVDGAHRCPMVVMGSGDRDGTWGDHECGERGAFLCGPDQCEPFTGAGRALRGCHEGQLARAPAAEACSRRRRGPLSAG